MMEGFFQPESQSQSPAPSPSLPPLEPSPTSSAILLDPPSNNNEVLIRYLSNISDDEGDSEEARGKGSEDEGADKTQMSSHNSLTMLIALDTDLFQVHVPPPLKR